MNPRSLITNTDFSNPFDIIQDTIDYLNSLTKGFESQITTNLSLEGTTRFANNQITQHTDLQNLGISLKLSKGKKLASSFTTTLNHENLSLFVKNTVNSLEKSPEISFYQGLPDPRKGPQVDGSGFAWSPEDRVQAIIDSVKAGEKIDPKVSLSGTASEQKNYRRIVTSNGIDVEDSLQMNFFKVNAISGTPDQRGYGQEAEFWRFTQPDYIVMAEESVNTALKTIKFMDLPAPKDYEVVLAPSAVSNFMQYLLNNINPVDFHEGNSFTSDRIGEQVFDKKLTIDNLPHDPKNAMIVSGFDNEGIATNDVTLIDNGVLKHIPYNSFFASKFLHDKNLTTGSDFSQFSFMNSVNPSSAVVKTGSKSLEDQISDVKDGLFVKTFWYIRFTIKKEGGLTGLTRNGLFHIKDGQIDGAVRNLRFTESFLKAFGPNNILSVGNIRKSDEETLAVPSMHLGKYHFSSVAHTFD